MQSADGSFLQPYSNEADETRTCATGARYQKSEIIYDGTVYFTNRFFHKYDRTVSQMVQAVRSGKQNIAEASMASATSKEMEMKLTNVARASLEELQIDYEDFLRTRKLPIWSKEHRLVARLRELNRSTPCNYDTFRKGHRA